MKQIRFMFAMLLMATTLAFTACSSDDDSLSNPLVGTWYGEYEDKKGNMRYEEITYNSDYTCTWRLYAKESTTAIVDSDIGTYEIRGNTLSLWWESERKYWNEGPYTLTYRISGNKMITQSEYGKSETWTRK